MSFDKLVGLAMLLVATAVFAYYSAWTFIVPFIDESSCAAKVFPPREWIVRIPAALLLAGVALIGTFIGSVLIKNDKKQKLKAKAKKAQ